MAEPRNATTRPPGARLLYPMEAEGDAEKVQFEETRAGCLGSQQQWRVINVCRRSLFPLLCEPESRVLARPAISILKRDTGRDALAVRLHSNARVLFLPPSRPLSPFFYSPP